MGCVLFAWPAIVMRSKYRVHAQYTEEADRRGPQLLWERQASHFSSHSPSSGQSVMEYINLPSGGRMPIVGFGTWQVSSFNKKSYIVDLIY